MDPLPVIMVPEEDPNNNANTPVTAKPPQEENSLEQMLLSCIQRFDAQAIKDIVLKGTSLKHVWLDARKYRSPLHELVLAYRSYHVLDRPHQLNLKFIEILTTLLQNGVDINDVDINRQTALHLLAATAGQADTIRVLLTSGIYVNNVDRNNQSALHLAVAEAGKKEVETLLDGGADPNVFNSMGYTPLHIAAKRKRNYEMINSLISMGAIVNSQTTNQRSTGPTPLHLACRRGCLENVRCLLHHGADPDLIEASGQSSLHVAASNDITGKITHALLNSRNPHTGSRPDPNIRDETFQETPLHKAVKYEMHNNVQVLLTCKKINVNATDSQKETPLHKAALVTGDVHMLTSLMKAGSNPRAQNIFEHTPLDKGVRAKNSNAVSVIRQYEDAEPRTHEYSMKRIPIIVTPMY